MKLTKMFFAFAIVAVMFASCKSEVELTGITLDESSLSVAVNDTAILTATLLPKGVAGDVTWASSNTTVATVKNGEVIGVKEGTSNIIATVGSFTATCVVTVTKEVIDFKKSLTGSEYYPIILDGVTAKALGSKIKADFRVDESIKFLYVWDNTYAAGPSTGPNFYGEVESWVSLTVGNGGWSGAGINIKTAGNAAALASLKAITDNPAGYYLHIGIKSKDNTVHCIILGGQTEIRFAIGATGFVDGANTFPAITDFTRDGDWQQIEIPMTTLKTMGLSYTNFGTDPNIFAFLSGGVPGKTLDLDAVFIYKK